MNLEDQVCSLEYAKKLKELGVKQESLFYWFRQFKDDEYLLHYVDYNHHEVDLKIFLNHFPDSYSAFTVAELGEMLTNIKTKKNFYRLEFIKNNDGAYLLAYVEHPDKPPLICIINANEANARAEMLIYLLDNGFMKCK